MKYLYCIVIFCFLGCTCKKGEIPEGSICPEYGSSIGRHYIYLLYMRQNPIVHQEVIQMKNKKLLTFC